MNSIKAEAIRRVNYMNLPPKPERLDGLIVELVVYDSDRLAGLLTGIASEKWHSCVYSATKRILERRHAIVKCRVLKWSDLVSTARNGEHKMFEHGPTTDPLDL